MIIRIVKMTFQEGKEKDFLIIFETNKNKIRNFEGCEYLELLQDTTHKNIFFTHSHWRDATYLEKYRFSELFRTTWDSTKTLFAAKPEAWSLNTVDI